jgi:hypothetical protein
MVAAYLLLAYVAEHIQLLLVLSPRLSFLAFSRMKTRELSGTFFRDAA